MANRSTAHVLNCATCEQISNSSRGDRDNQARGEQAVSLAE